MGPGAGPAEAEEEKEEEGKSCRRLPPLAAPLALGNLLSLRAPPGSLLSGVWSSPAGSSKGFLDGAFAFALRHGNCSRCSHLGIWSGFSSPLIWQSLVRCLGIAWFDSGQSSCVSYRRLWCYSAHFLRVSWTWDPEFDSAVGFGTQST